MPGTFDIDHKNMFPGLYSPGSDIIGESEIITVDVRVVAPYLENTLKEIEVHTVEHILATELGKACEEYSKSYSEAGGSEGVIKKIYWGPMGCMTGFYLLVQVPSSYSNKSHLVASVLYRACLSVVKEKKYYTPAKDIRRCGNFLTLYRTADSVMWIIKRIMKLCEDVNENGGFDQYKEIKDEVNE